MSLPQGLSDAQAAALLHEQLPALRAFAMGLSRDKARADDLVQDTLLKAWSRFDLFTPGTSLKAWLFTILRNIYYSDLRRERQRRRHQADEGAPQMLAYERPAHDGRIAMSEFLTALQQLAPEQREALILVGACGFSVSEAAAMTSVAEGTVKSRVSRARARLCEILQLRPGETPMDGDKYSPTAPDQGTAGAA